MFDATRYIENGLVPNQRTFGPSHAPCAEGIRRDATGSKNSKTIAVHGRHLDGSPLVPTVKRITRKIKVSRGVYCDGDVRSGTLHAHFVKVKLVLPVKPTACPPQHDWQT